MRTSPAELPTYEELLSILAAEAKRDISTEKMVVHYADFSSIIALLHSYNLPADFFTENYQFTDFKDKNLFNQTVDVFNALVENILLSSENTDQLKLFNDVYGYLSEEDQPKKTDIIFVFGSKQTFRIEKAVELYMQGFASKILISGRGPSYEEARVSEAEKLATVALEAGLSEGDLLLEKESITIPDNIKRSLNLLESMDLPHKNIMLVNSPFVQRRGWCHFMKMSQPGTVLIRQNAFVSENFSKMGWYKNEVGAKLIIKEFFGMRISEMLNTS